ncbi:MAG: phage antirepressor KilAC domain-containing protein [Bacteroidales bacterium]|nr:phage antirepressor KilAC domain-containing protein [Bacteroidales bacterium]
MKTDIQIFRNEIFGEIRTMTNMTGETFFVGKDVAQALGYANTRKAIQDHVEAEDKTDGVTIRDAIGRNQTMILINESGLYSLILSSKLEQAKAFKRWVTSEVLPAIRQTGCYELAPKGLKLLGAKAEYADEVLLSVDCLTTTQVAKEMSMTASELYRWLVALRIVYWQSGQYMLYADYARAGYGKGRTWHRRNRLGRVHTETYLVWTEAGRKFLHEVFDNQGNP